MFYYLSPEDDGINGPGPLLTPEEIVRRWQQEFKFIHVDKERGKKHIEERLNYLRGLQAKGKNPYGMPIEPEIEGLIAILNKTVFVVISDDDPPGNLYLSAYLLPGWPKIIVRYSSPDHCEEAELLLHRCAAALKYEIEEGG